MWILHYDVSALILSIFILIIFYAKKKVFNLQNKMFHRSLIVVIIANLLDILSALRNIYPDNHEYFLLWTSTSVYMIFRLMSSFLFALFIMSLTFIVPKLSKFLKMLLHLPLIFTLIIILSNYFTRAFFYIDKDLVYHRGKFMLLFYIINAFYMVFAFVYAFLNKKVMPKSVLITLSICILVEKAFSIFQLLFPKYLVECLGISLSYLILMITLDSIDSYIDHLTGILNRKAFVNNMNDILKSRIKVSVLLINIEDSTLLIHTFGLKYVNEMLKNISKYLENIVKLGDCFYLGEKSFALYSFDGTSKTNELVSLVLDRFNKSWKISEVDIDVSIRMSILECPEDVQNVDDILDYLEFSKNIKNIDESKIIIAKEVNKSDRIRTLEIESIVKVALKENKFEVYYQPIYSKIDKRITAAEALIRLYDDKMGFISPEEFIPISEKNGNIVKIGKFVFETVCNFIATHDLNKLGLNYISINLSVVQCMQKKLVEELFSIIKQYNINSNQICLEITETSAAFSPEILSNNIKTLSDANIKLSLDDYGTGYSNLSYVMNLPFNIIKIDKSLVWSSFETKKSKIALESIVTMLKKLNLTIVAEGIETEEQAYELIRIGCDLLQGYYFSKPVNQERFIEYIRMVNKIS